MPLTVQYIPISEMLKGQKKNAYLRTDELWHYKRGFPDGSGAKKKKKKMPAGAAGDLGSTLASGRFPEVGNSNPLRYSCQYNPMDRGAWRATVHEVSKSQI